MATNMELGCCSHARFHWAMSSSWPLQAMAFLEPRGGLPFQCFLGGLKG